MSDLAKKNCIPCKNGVSKFTYLEVNEYLTKVKDWRFENNFITKEFTFKNFALSLQFVNKVGEVAETENHHPNIDFTWGYVKISIQTHAIKGICENDFILAAKIDQLN